MRNKMITGVIVSIIILSATVLFWYLSPPNVSIVGLEAPKELGIEELGNMNVMLQNNDLKDVNVTINVKNAFVDEKGNSLKTSQLVTDENGTYKSLDIVPLKPGRNNISVFLGYQVPGVQKVEVELYQHGKLADSSSIEINVPTAKINVYLRNYKGINGTDEIHTVYGDLGNSGKSYAHGVIVNISVINETTNKTVSTITRIYSLTANSYGIPEPMIAWRRSNSTYDPVTNAMTTIQTETYAPIVVIELAKDEPSTEKYIMSPIVIKGKIGDRYKVVVTARWMDQVVSSEIMIPPFPVREKTPEEAIADAQAEVSFKILQPGYIPVGYRMNTAQTSGTKFHGVSSELEQALLPYTKGNEFLNLQELLVIKDDTDVSESVARTPYKYVDINGTQGRFLEEASGTKTLSWKIGNLDMTISSYAYNGSGFTVTSLGMDEMIKMARSVK